MQLLDGAEFCLLHDEASCITGTMIVSPACRTGTRLSVLQVHRHALDFDLLIDQGEDRQLLLHFPGEPELRTPEPVSTVRFRFRVPHG